MLAWLGLVWLAANALVVAVYRRELARLWREPVFRHPVLIVESDDWGAGPLQQAQALRDLAEVLDRHRDASGRAPTLNLALVLAVADGPAIQANGTYRRICLDDPVFAPVLAALRDGQARGVFALQLHGLEHYWPQALMASGDAGAKAWLAQPVPAITEQLPSPLQSRWVDASSLPSTPHAAAAIEAAVAEEVRAYERIVGSPPKVVVPPTFVWTTVVEQAWAARGVECLVTPGWRYTQRNADGLPGGDQGPLANGDRSCGLTVMARTDYFEPARGRDAVYALRALDRAAAEGRPCMLENHRDNFIGDAQICERSLRELDRLYREALQRQPGLRFMTSRELGSALQCRDPLWLVGRAVERLPCIWSRLRHSGRPWKLLSSTGFVALAALVLRLAGVSMARMPRSAGP